LLGFYFFFLVACGRIPVTAPMEGDFGGRDTVTVDLPFEDGYETRCTQGVGGNYSHIYTSTAYDIDFDTPNNRSDLIFAPVGGTVYVHDEDVSHGFGLHLNIDLGDGTYIVLAHLSSVLVENGEEVEAGEILGFEGTTGASTGDHVHMGRHLGDASLDADMGTSIRGLRLALEGDTDPSETGDVMAEDLWCDLSWGHIYRSTLAVNLWHPNGTIVTTPDQNDLYLLEEGALRKFPSETAFWNWNYSYRDNVALVSPSEFDCYSTGADMPDGTVIALRDDDGVAWLFVGRYNDPNRVRMAVPSAYEDEILQTWGLSSAGVMNMHSADMSGFNGYPYAIDSAVFRDGALLKETGNSAVYTISGGVALPIDHWETFLLQDYWGHEIIEVPSGAIQHVQMRVGSCAQGEFCLTASKATQCGYALPDFIEEELQDTGQGPDDTDSDTDTEAEPETDIVYCWADHDHDGYGSGVSHYFTVEPGGTCHDVAIYLVPAEGEEDCNDSDASVHPDGREICENRVDDDCDYAIDERSDCVDESYSASRELCWEIDSSGSLGHPLSNAIDGELWVYDLGWYTAPAVSTSGTFSDLCTAIAGSSGDVKTVNGTFYVAMEDYNEDEVPWTGAPADTDSDDTDDAYQWWICANWDGSGEYSGRFEIDGVLVEPDVVSNGGTGFDCELTIP